MFKSHRDLAMAGLNSEIQDSQHLGIFQNLYTLERAGVFIVTPEPSLRDCKLIPDSITANTFLHKFELLYF
jgi:hypothetical protein